MRCLLLLLTCLVAQSATLQQTRDRVDSWLAARWDTITNRMENYKATNFTVVVLEGGTTLTNRGGYFQGLITHVTIPAHTSSTDNDTIPDRLAVQLHDQSTVWTNLFPEFPSTPFPCAVVIDTYNAPINQYGWLATLYIRFNGTIYHRANGVGPLNDELKFNWRVYTPPSP